MKNLRTISLIVIFLANCLFAQQLDYKNPSLPVDERVASLLYSLFLFIYILYIYNYSL